MNIECIVNSVRIWVIHAFSMHFKYFKDYGCLLRPQVARLRPSDTCILNAFAKIRYKCIFKGSNAFEFLSFFKRLLGFSTISKTGFERRK